MITENQMKGEDGVCDTVAIKGPDGPVMINAHDFDPAVHQKLDEQETTPTEDVKKPRKQKE